MSKKLKVWVYGAGAVGGFYGSFLQKAGHDVLFISRGEQLSALQKKGLQVQSVLGDYHLHEVKVCAEDHLEQAFEPDLVIVAVKSYSNAAVAAKLKALLKPGVKLFVFQNGVSSHKIFQAAFGAGPVLRAVVNVAVTLREPGLLVHSSGGFAALQNDEDLAPLVLAAFKQAGCDGKLTTNIAEFIWSKMLWNAAFNSVTALCRLTTTPILQDEDGKNLIENLMKEVICLAAAEGVHLPSGLIQEKIDFTLNKLGDITSSTLEDVKAGKQLEYNAIVGELVQLAKAKNISAPYLQTVFTLLKLLDCSFQSGK